MSLDHHMDVIQPDVQDLKLPIELWRLIFALVHPISARTPLLYICRALHPEALRARLRAATARTHRQICSLHICLRATRSPDAYFALRTLTVHAVTMWNPLVGASVPSVLPHVFARLTALEELRLKFYPGRERAPIEEPLAWRAEWFPSLRVLASCVATNEGRGLRAFLAAHPRLEQLYVAPGREDRVAGAEVALPALRVLACSSAFAVHGVEQGCNNVTHLELYTLSVADLQKVADVFGARLVGLRCGPCRDEGEPWTVRKVVQAFPELNAFAVAIDLTLEAQRGVAPSASIFPVDWSRAGALGVEEAPKKKIDVYWAISARGSGGENTADENVVRCIVQRRARQLLLGWSHHVEAVKVFCETPYETRMCYRVEGDDVVGVEDQDMHYGDWNGEHLLAE
ncbi:uncharacterized protein BXZ73DRAFT_76499 [Epithele typhae]|uniref:uncharacterized protein n=1 Tax=Epithele typhae TaxID=378194 RepID=UPI0020084F91|nr:uncharacterized protein BXZ73DRAFT_76499 [Epithele typhae]KAH9937871.1 hypothetical protein BXZ73DRAFT_76499 [Epithele typhae]